jgi:hypothetical protein
VPRKPSVAGCQTEPFFTRRTSAQPPPSKLLLHVNAVKKKRRKRAQVLVKNQTTGMNAGRTKK